MSAVIRQLCKFSKSVWKSAPLAVLGIGLYVFSWFLSNLYWYAADLLWLFQEPQEMIAGYRYLKGVDLPQATLDDFRLHTLQLRLFQFAAMLLMGIYCTVCACLVKTTLARLVWWILAIAELFSVVEYTVCKMVADKYTIFAMSKIIALEGESSACQRLAGPGGHYIAPFVTTLVLGWILWRAFQVWRNTTPKHTAGL